MQHRIQLLRRDHPTIHGPSQLASADGGFTPQNLLVRVEQPFAVHSHPNIYRAESFAIKTKGLTSKPSVHNDKDHLQTKLMRQTEGELSKVLLKVLQKMELTRFKWSDRAQEWRVFCKVERRWDLVDYLAPQLQLDMPKERRADFLFGNRIGFLPEEVYAFDSIALLGPREQTPLGFYSLEFDEPRIKSVGGGALLVVLESTGRIWLNPEGFRLISLG